ncbi:MAG: hypothetical protein ACJA1A_001995 [Saprospiraceae bacterium]
MKIKLTTNWVITINYICHGILKRKKKYMFGKLKSLFILEDDNETKKAAEKGKQEQTKVYNKESSPGISAHDISVDLTNITPPPSGKPDAKFVDILLKAVEKDNLEGFDYLEYKSSLQSLAGMDMDESTRYKSALAMAKTMGATPSKLIKTAQHYLNTLEKEKSKFQDALKGQTSKQVTGKESSINKISETIAKKNQRILDLQKEIEADTAKVKTMKVDIDQAVAKVQATSDSFHYAYNVVTGQILADVEKMENYLK